VSVEERALPVFLADRLYYALYEVLVLWDDVLKFVRWPELVERTGVCTGRITVT
jgi:hypothetical protein